jgi:hypothetical protein
MERRDDGTLVINQNSDAYKKFIENEEKKRDLTFKTSIASEITSRNTNYNDAVV